MRLGVLHEMGTSALSDEPVGRFRSGGVIPTDSMLVHFLRNLYAKLTKLAIFYPSGRAAWCAKRTGDVIK